MLGWIVEVWTAYAHRAASYQTRVLLTLVYGLILGPAALIGRMFGTRLLDLRSSGSTWIQRPTSDSAKSVAGLRRQF